VTVINCNGADEIFSSAMIHVTDVLLRDRRRKKDADKVFWRHK